MAPRVSCSNGQTRAPRSVTSIDRAIFKGCRKIVHLSPVDLLIDAFLHVLKYNGELLSGGGVGPQCHGEAGGLDKKEVIIQQRPSSLDTASVKVVVEAAHVRVPKGGAMQEAWRLTVQLGKPAFIVTGVWGWGAGGAGGACSRKSGAAGRGRGRGALAGAVVLNHQVFDAVHSRMEGQVPAAGAGSAPSAESIRAEGSAEATGAQPSTTASSSTSSSSQGSW